MGRFKAVVCCTALALMTALGARAGLVFGDAGLTVEALVSKQVDFIENHPQRRN